jgi:transitional endoplasmic reticulum ATPase
MAEKIQLIVKEPYTRDIGRGVARIHPKIFEKLRIREKNPIIIEKVRTAVAWALPLPYDEQVNIIRLDKDIRKSVGVSLDDVVYISPTNISAAKKVMLIPTEKLDNIDRSFINMIHNKLIGRPLIRGNVIAIHLFGSPLYLKVKTTSPSGAVYVTDNTRVVVSTDLVGKIDEVEIRYDDIGGLDREIEKIREMVELPLKYPELFQRLGIDPPKGVLLYGPPGCGKTLLAKAVATESEANFFAINGPEITSKYYGESEAKLREIFRKAEENSPSIIFIDELDSIAPKREEVSGEAEKRVVAQLLTLMDGLKGRGQIIVIGATNRVEAIDPALRRPGRFDREIEIRIPDEKGRLEILKIHTRGMPLNTDVDLQKLASITHGYTGADIQALCREAAMKALKRYLPIIEKDYEGKIPEEVLENMTVTMKDFMDAYREIVPTAMREVEVSIPRVSWEDIGGLEEVKNVLRETVEWPLKYPERFKRLGIDPPKGVLLYGPPGTGKTLLAQAIASETNMNFIAVKGPELLSKWVGESEKGVRRVFARARTAAPSIIFFDEIEALIPSRGTDTTTVTDRVISQFLTELDGINRLEDVIVIGATNRPDLIDKALLRPGRMDLLVYVPPPDRNARLSILRIHTRRMSIGPDVDLEKIADMTEYYTGADLHAIVREAAMNALRRDPNAEYVTMDDFMGALNKIPPSLDDNIIDWYKNYARKMESRKLSLPPAFA